MLIETWRNLRSKHQSLLNISKISNLQNRGCVTANTFIYFIPIYRLPIVSDTLDCGGPYNHKCQRKSHYVSQVASFCNRHGSNGWRHLTDPLRTTWYFFSEPRYFKIGFVWGDKCGMATNVDGNLENSLQHHVYLRKRNIAWRKEQVVARVDRIAQIQTLRVLKNKQRLDWSGKWRKFYAVGVQRKISIFYPMCLCLLACVCWCVQFLKLVYF